MAASSSSPLDALDALQDTDPTTALDGYLAQADALDPDDPRMGWILAQDPPGDHPAYGPLVRRIHEQTSDRALRRLAAYTLATAPIGGLEEPDQEALYKEVLAEPLGRHDEIWRRACVNLALFYRLRVRLFEALVVARRAEEVAREAGDARGHAVACLHRCAVLVTIRDRVRLPDALDAFEAAMADTSFTGRSQVLPALLVGFRAEAAELAGDLEEAYARYEDFDRLTAALPEAHAFRVEGWIAHARALTRGQRLAEAEALLLAAEDADVQEAHIPLQREMEGLRLAQAARGSRRALPRARRVLDMLARPGQLMAPGTRFQFAADVATILGDGADVLDEYRAALDVAGAAALERILELERAMASLPAGTGPTAEDLAILSEYRARFHREHRELLGTIASLLQTQPGGAAALIVQEDSVAICAWCQCVRTQTGRWLPLGHFLPRGDQLRLTHGICDACRERQFEG